MVEFSNRDELRDWLEKQPRGISLAISSRSALRILPSLARLESINNKTAGAIIQPTFRAVMLTWASATWPEHLKDLSVYAANAVGAANAARTVHAASAADAASVIYTPTYAARAARAVYSIFDPAIHVDTNEIEVGLSVTKLMQLSLYIELPLLPESTRDRQAIEWQKLKEALLSLNEDWDVWTDWYEARLRGDAPNESLEIARATISNEIWKQGPKVVNAHIKALIKEHIPPETPLQGPGPTFSVHNNQLAHSPTPPLPDESDDETQQKLFDRLKARLPRLLDHKGRLANQHPQLFENLSDYQNDLDAPELSKLDISMLWMSGAGVIEQARAYRDHDPDRSLTPALEPEIDALLQEISRLHAAFIMGFKEGQKLSNRADFPVLDKDELLNLVNAERSITRAILAMAEQHIAPSAREVFTQLQHMLEATYLKLEAQARTGLPVVRNVLISIGTITQKIAITGAVIATGLGLAPELAPALVAFLRDTAGPITAFATNFPELREYMLWLYDHLDDKKDDAG